MGNVLIGKHALESLTRGMYADPFVIYREYIQNAADAIDEAVKNNLLKKNEGKIDVQIFPLERTIIIKDNGTGLSSKCAEKTLINIGNSKKLSDNARGFRGIGRLAALSYCGKLIFETSFAGENEGSKITIDAKKLSARLLMSGDVDVSAEDVIQEVYSVEHYKEQEEKHYLNVIIKDLEDDENIIDYNQVYEYLAQNVPVPYNTNTFKWGKEIKARLKSEGYEIPEYNIFLTFSGKSLQIFKAYTDEFFIDKKRNVSDKIKDINVFKLSDSCGEISAYCWIANTSYLGSLHNGSIKGLRIRKGNILIGDGQTLNTCFKDARFNGWILGEIFVVDPQLIPNARRDNFEKNASYYVFIEQLKNIAITIVKNIRHLSIERNSQLSCMFEKKDVIKNKIDMELNNEKISKEETSALQGELVNTKKAIEKVSASTDIDIYNKSIAFDEIDMLIGKLHGTTSYKSINALQNLNSEEKMILEKVFDAIVSIETSKTEELINAILEKFSI